MAEIGTVGFIGVGAMGYRMAANLVRAGRDVLVHDIAAGQVQAFVAEHGGRAAADLGELGRAADMVITMLPTGADVRAVLLGAPDGGLARSLRPATVVVDMSSSEPTGTRALAGELAAMGLVLIDAPVSGGIGGAEKGALTLMIGTDDAAALERVRPVLTIMGPRQFETGGSGSGHAMKALNNLMSGAGFILMAEVLVAGRKFGLDPAVMLDIINASTGRNHATEAVGQEHVVGGAFATRFLLGLMAKDVKIAADMTEDLQLHAPMCRMTRDLWLRARDVVGAGADHTEAVRYWEELNGIRIAPPEG